MKSSLKEKTFPQHVDRAIEKLELKKPKKRKNQTSSKKIFNEMLERCFYLDTGKQTAYVYQQDNYGYLKQSLSDLRRRFRLKGIEVNPPVGLPYSEADKLIERIQDERRIHYLGGLAGHPIGLYEHPAGAKFLIDSEATLLEPKKGKYPLLKSIFEGITSKNNSADGGAQFHILMSWVRRSYIAIRDHNRSTDQQALVIAGEQGAGKTLTSNILTTLLGGRSADASRYMLKDNDFNGDLCDSEILLLDDKSSSSKIADRLRFGSQIKTHTVTTNNISLHRKNCDAVTVSLLWRIIICLNDNAESLMVLPPLNDDIAEKLILLKGHHFKMPWDTSGDGEREKFWSALVDEMPHFLHWLLNEYETPNNYKGSRYGVKSYHNPEIAEKLNTNSPEHALLDLIDEVLWIGGERKWTGTATELKDALVNNYTTKMRAMRLLGDYAETAGRYLGRLSSKYGDRVKRARKSKKRDWVIYSLDDGNDAMTLKKKFFKKKSKK